MRSCAPCTSSPFRCTSARLVSSTVRNSAKEKPGGRGRGGARGSEREREGERAGRESRESVTSGARHVGGPARESGTRNHANVAAVAPTIPVSRPSRFGVPPGYALYPSAHAAGNSAGGGADCRTRCPDTSSASPLTLARACPHPRAHVPKEWLHRTQRHESLDRSTHRLFGRRGEQPSNLFVPRDSAASAARAGMCMAAAPRRRSPSSRARPGAEEGACAPLLMRTCRHALPAGGRDYDQCGHRCRGGFPAGDY